MGENENEVDVDNLLEQAFQRVEDSDKNGKEGKSKHPMDDIIMSEARKAGLTGPKEEDGGSSVVEKRRSDNRRRRQSSSSSGGRDDPDSDEDRTKSRRKKRSRSREKRSRSRERKKRDSSRDRKKKSGSPEERRRSKKRSGSRERRRKDRSRSRSRDRISKKRSSRDVSRERLSSRRRSRSRSRSPIRSSRVSDRRDSPPSWRRSPPPRPQRLPGPERRDVMPFTARRSPPRGAKLDMTPEERDERTIFILQLSRNTRPRDLEEFFSSVGHVRDVRIITDSKTRRSKGIAYVEFWEREGVPLAMGLNGQKLVGCPLVIQMTCAERNRVANATMGGAIGFGLSNSVGPLKLCVSNLHSHINDDMLSAIFEPFGKIEKCSIERDSTGSSKGQGFVTFRHAEEGKRAMEQLNGFELAGRNIRLTTIDDEPQQPQAQQQQLSLDAEDRMNLNSQGRQQLMAKLAQGTGMELPKKSAAPVMTGQSVQVQAAPVHYQSEEETPATTATGIPAIATQCFMLSNMFDPASESEPGWELDVRDDVIEECQSCVHIYVDKASESGNVYVKCPTAAIAYKSVTALHGRWFAGKIITANYVPVASYHDLFPEARAANVPLQARPR